MIFWAYLGFFVLGGWLGWHAQGWHAQGWRPEAADEDGVGEQWDTRHLGGDG